MVTLLFFIFGALTVFFAIIGIKEHNKSYGGDGFAIGVYVVGLCISVLVSCILLIKVINLTVDVKTANTIKQKIEMYEQKNLAIEENIDAIVKNYMAFEADTYAEVKDKDAISLVSVFPDLKSDSLVQQQIELYMSNNQKLLELNEEEINLSRKRFELYFGR